MVQLVKIGKETVKLDELFARITEHYVEEVEYKTSTLSSAMEPTIIISLALIVGVTLVSMNLPLFEMSNSFQ